MSKPEREFWAGKRVLLTGHTGFKGSWLALWLQQLGAQVTGYALAPPTVPSLFALARIGELIDSHLGDVRDGATLAEVVAAARPEIVLHLAAQPLVRESYRLPQETYATNVMGTVHLLEAVRRCDSVRAVVNVTTDKCYDNREWCWGYRENEPLGGFDPYSSSKACAELVSAAYRTSFFSAAGAQSGVALATARAGNVIGGGDWAGDRLVPDCLRALLADAPVRIRNPHAIRPWQHVLEPLSGYLLLARRLYEAGAEFAEAWNFGPAETDARPVAWIVERLCGLWGESAGWQLDPGEHPHEANYLKLDCSKARTRLGWSPAWNLGEALEAIVAWTRAYKDGADLRAFTLSQIETYQTRQP